jgi:hypothetical protein
MKRLIRKILDYPVKGSKFKTRSFPTTFLQNRVGVVTRVAQCVLLCQRANCKGKYVWYRYPLQDSMEYSKCIEIFLEETDRL